MNQRADVPALHEFRVLTFDVVGTLIDFEAGILDCVHRMATGRVDDTEVLESRPAMLDRSVYSEVMATAERKLTPAARRVLDVASELFYANGIHAVGVELIAAQAGVTKKTLYDRFGSKDALVELYLRTRDERWREHVREVVEGAHTSAEHRPLLVFDALEQWMDRDNPRGCAFVNAHAELPEGDHPARQVIREQKQWVLDYLYELVLEAGSRDPRRRAEELAVLLEGATVMRTAGVAPSAMSTAKDLARRALDDAPES